MKRYLSLLILFCLAYPAVSQDLDSEFNHFYSFNIDYRINKKFKLQAGELFNFKSNSYNFSFTQFKLGGDYRISKRISANLLYKPMFYKGTTRDIWYQRISGSASYRSKIFSLPLKHTLGVDWFFPKLNKYQYRFVYTIKLSFKNKFLPLRATPYLKYQLYYYLNGNPVDYYDESGETLLASNPPNDFHRYRIGVGVRFRPAKHFYISLYYIWQEEFNTTFTKNKQLNVLNKNQTRIKNPFNDYQVLGISLSYTINRKK